MNVALKAEAAPLLPEVFSGWFAQRGWTPRAHQLELLARARAGRSTLLIQGTSGTPEEAIRYGWNYARLLAEGPTPAALVPSPVMTAMETGGLARIEELTRIPSDVQDALITVLSEKTLPVPELGQEVQAVKGFNVIATANDRDAAGLMGINTRAVITFSYALSSATAAFAGVLVAPLTLTGATMGASLGLKAFAVAIIGGLTSGVGAIVGGLLLGITETTAGYYISTGYKDVPGLLLLLLVLAIKPSGLFGKAAIKKV